MKITVQGSSRPGTRCDYDTCMCRAGKRMSRRTPRGGASGRHASSGRWGLPRSFRPRVARPRAAHWAHLTWPRLVPPPPPPTPCCSMAGPTTWLPSRGCFSPKARIPNRRLSSPFKSEIDGPDGRARRESRVRDMTREHAKFRSISANLLCF